MTVPPTPPEPPDVVRLRSAFLVKHFTRHVHRFMAKRFSAVRLAREGARPAIGDGPLVVVLNHPSWWDPMMCVVLAARFPTRTAYAPIDAEALRAYGFFRKLGFFGVEQGTLAGARAFLRTGTTLLARPHVAIWITPQGEFRDVRDRPPRLAPGVGHLARHLRGGAVLPLAVEYPFWDESKPEALAAFGEPIAVEDGHARTPAAWTARFEDALAATQDALAARARARDPEAFEALIGGSAGVGGVYDAWRRFRAWLRGERFDPTHAAAMKKLGGGE